MKKQDLWPLLTGVEESKLSAAEILDRTSYDELFEINVVSDRYRILNHVDDKYLSVVQEGVFSRLHDFALVHYVHPEDAGAYREFLDIHSIPQRLAAAEIPGALTGSFRFRSTNGDWLWTRQLLIDGPELGKPQGLVYCFVYDTQRQRQRLEGEPEDGPAQMEDRREEVTGLLEGVDYFRAVQSRLHELDGGWCVIDIDIQHYKLFFDWYGMESGQLLLSRIAEILRRTEADHGMPGYLGRDQFCLVIPYDEGRIRSLYDELQALISSVSAIDGFAPIFGIALIDGSSSQIMEYYNHAALTAEELQGSVSTRIQVYDAAFHKKHSEEYQLLFAFKKALENGEIEFWLQPQYRVSNQKIVGAESLARWIRPDGRTVSPADFVPLLEKYDLITKMDVFIWESVCRWLRSWIDRGRKPVPISVNVSQIDLFAIDVPAFFSQLLEKYGLSPGDLKIEITESAYVDDTGTVRQAVSGLRKAGFMVMMDDFGSGYSSLNMLRSIEMDVIKLDAQFLRIGEGDEHKGINILESVVNMTRNLATPIIVEGVETLDQVTFLSEMGCRYMQGFFFNKPVPVKEFESLIENESAIDSHGIVFKANQQIQVREFLDRNIYSDVMLNNILGPVAFYYWHGEDVDIIRYNEQFYRLVGIEAEELNARQNSIQKYLHPRDREKLYSLLRYAEEHHTVGAKGVIRSYRPNGVQVWLELQLYFIDQDRRGGKKYYASAQDVTELQFLSSELPGAYYRCSLEEDFTFLFIGQNFMRLTGFSEAEIRAIFDNKLINMVHPKDREKLKEEADAIARGEQKQFRPYRLQRKVGDYVYVAEQSLITDKFGSICWQGVVIDVDDVMRIRNQMRILSKYLTDTILFLRRVGQNLEYEVAVHGLAGHIGMDAEEFRQLLNAGELCRYVQGSRPGIPHQEYTKLFVASILDNSREIMMDLPGRKSIRLLARADRVGDEKSAIEYIVVLHLIE